jgi:hypothetical protein
VKKWKNEQMKRRASIFTLVLILYCAALYAQESYSFEFRISITPEYQNQFCQAGRLFIILNENPTQEPRLQLWPFSTRRNHIFAKNINNWHPEESFTANSELSFATTSNFNFKRIPKGTYFIQALWDHDTAESSINAPGNLYSKVDTISISSDSLINIVLDHKIPTRNLIENNYVKLIEFQSDTLSAWWKKTVMQRASVLLPNSYFDDMKRSYPIRYNVAGLGGRYTRVNRLVNNDKFSEWWFSDDAPQIINVFLDGEGPFGDCYQLDSENNGPYGYSFIHELIPHIEKKFRVSKGEKYRFVDGCSTGGWVSLALQFYFPDIFNGVWSYSPDPVDFEHYQLVNIYKDENVFYNEWGNLRPLARDLSGEPTITMKDMVLHENVLGSSNSYLNSGGQFCAHTALYSPRGENGLPTPMFDPISGEIDTLVANEWKKFDLKLYLENNWQELGTKLKGKIFIWMGDMDHFYLNSATRSLEEFFNETENPKSDAILKFEAMEGHCSKFSHKKILTMIADRVHQLETGSN